MIYTGGCMDAPKIRARSQLEGNEGKLFDLSANAADILRSSLTQYVESLTHEQKELLRGKSSFFVYNTILLFTLQELYYLNSLNNITLEDAISNVDTLTNSLKAMLSNAWEALIRGRDSDEIKH